MIDYLDIEDLLAIAAQLGVSEVRDIGLLGSAAHRPTVTVFGTDAYPGLPAKAAALLSSIARNHALVDGNKRLAWTAAVTFCALNDIDLDPPSVDAAYDLVIAAATGTLDVPAIAETIGEWMRPASAAVVEQREGCPDET